MSIDRRILIADDDFEVRTGVVELLYPLGLEVLEAESGSEALEILRVRPIDLALLDMHMPGRSGLELLTILQHESPRLRCIFWSGDSTEAIERMARAAGAWAVLRKPLEPSRLRDEVIRALELDARPS
jgi:CheY-like chemotaxis protein